MSRRQRSLLADAAAAAAHFRKAIERRKPPTSGDNATRTVCRRRDVISGIAVGPDAGDGAADGLWRHGGCGGMTEWRARCQFARGQVREAGRGRRRRRLNALLRQRLLGVGLDQRGTATNGARNPSHVVLAHTHTDTDTRNRIDNVILQCQQVHQQAVITVTGTSCRDLIIT